MTLRNRVSVLVAGGTGLLGSALVARLVEARIPGLAATRFASPGIAAPGVRWEPLDLDSAPAAGALLGQLAPRVVVNAALPSGGAANGAGIVTSAERLASAARQVGAAFLHVSSDMVFDGTHGPFAEGTPPSPITAYGRAKADAERAVLAAHRGAILVRAPLLYRVTPPDRALMGWLAGLARGDAYTLFEDEIRCPAHVDDVAGALARACERLLAGETVAPPVGAYHAVGPVPVSRYALGVAMLRALGQDPTQARRGRLADSGLVRPRELVLTTAGTPAWLCAGIRSPGDALGVPVTPWRGARVAPPAGPSTHRA